MLHHTRQRATSPLNTGPISDHDLEGMRRRCDAALPGPWISFVEGRDHTSGSDFIRTGEGDTRGPDLEIPGATHADQDFIAHARQDIPRLLAEIDRLKNELRMLQP